MGAQLDTGGDKGGAKPTINITPLVDVVLVLLIIFIVVMPEVQEGKNINLVKVDQAQKIPEEDEPLIVTVDASETYTLGEDEGSTREQVIEALTEEYATNPGRRILLRLDADLPFKFVREFFAEVQDVGFVSIALAVGVSAEWQEKNG